jgi:hypothetical protein
MNGTIPLNYMKLNIMSLTLGSLNCDVRSKTTKLTGWLSCLIPFHCIMDLVESQEYFMTKVYCCKCKEIGV